MIRHFASLAAVLAALALVAAPEQAFAADVADDTRGAASEPVQTASDSADSSQVVASEPVQPGQPVQAAAVGQAGHDLGTVPTSSFTLELDPSDDDGSGEAPPEALAPDDGTVDPDDETPAPPEQPELPEPDQTSSPAPPAEEAPAAPSDMPSASEETPESSSSSEADPEETPAPTSSSSGSPSSGSAPTSSPRTFESDPGYTSDSSWEDGDSQSTASASSAVVAQDSSTRTIGGLLAFTGAGAALVLAALTLLALGLLMLWRSRVEEQALF